MILKRVPVIVVIGATGTGKSKLALDIAQKYGGEIISVDSMQIYQGLDIITNKVTAEERLLARHHMIDCASPLTRWTVLDFRRRALPIIDKLLAKGRVPVIVGGTNYYIDSILWKVLLDPSSTSPTSSDDDESSPPPPPPPLVFDEDVRLGGDQSLTLAANIDDLPFCTPDAVKHLSSAHLHQLLKTVDPVMADVYHPNNRRKIVRSLQAWQQHGRPHSELLKSQREGEGGSTLGGPLRYQDTLIFWVQCQQEVLVQRLNERVDDMIGRGLLAELAHFHQLYNAQRLQQQTEADYTTGIFQSIGFKEFHEYLTLPSSEETGNEQQRRQQQLLDEGIEALKVVTRRYARKQIKWIRNRFLQQPDRPVPPVYGLDASDPSLWNATVRDVAFDIIDSFVEDKSCPHPPLPPQECRREQQTSYSCSVCDKIMVGQTMWQAHLKSNRHRKQLNKAKNKNQHPTPVSLI